MSNLTPAWVRLLKKLAQQFKTTANPYYYVVVVRNYFDLVLERFVTKLQTPVHTYSYQHN
jgi:hypothetical protein